MGAKRSLNLSIDSELIDIAKSSGLNLSIFVEQQLREKMQTLADEQWKQENAEAIKSHNDYTDKYGLWCDEYRTW